VTGDAGDGGGPAVPPHLIRHRAITFIELARVQVDRYEEAAMDMVAAHAATMYRRALAEDSPHREAWLAVGDSGDERLTLGHFWRATNEHYLALVVLAQVSKAVRLLDLPDAPSYPEDDPLVMLRNIEEHWEEEGRSLTALRQTDPGAAPGRIFTAGKHQFIGTTSVHQVRQWLSATEEVVRRAADVADEPLPHADDELRL
jgi:hypothetical protein